jgi:hypothetical protein
MTQAVALAQQASTGVSQGFKNRVINGAMVIDQRNAGASVTNSASTTYTLDRWQMFGDQASKFSIQQVSTTMTGFTYALKVTSLSAYTLATDDRFFYRQKIEGFNMADLNWGTANAKTVTLSFKVKSSLTGTFGGAIGNDDGTRSYPFTYTISSANTETSVSVTIAGPTSGTWLTTNGIGMTVNIGLGVQGSVYAGPAGAWANTNYYSATGAVSVVSTNGATLEITGVQLEVGSTATSFDYRPYGTELQLCQRYYEFGKTEISQGVGSNGFTQFTVPYKQTKRATPTTTATNGFSIGGGSSVFAICPFKVGAQSTEVDFTASAEL